MSQTRPQPQQPPPAATPREESAVLVMRGARPGDLRVRVARRPQQASGTRLAMIMRRALRA